MEQIYNPYLPLTEHIPDGEPHVFGDRVYVYGSHDLAGGTAFCEGDYAVWSAPVDNLRAWRLDEAVSYRKTQDPSGADGTHMLYAPDCAQGPDGKYYLYYALQGVDEIGVAVSDVPQGPFEFYGHVKFPEGECATCAEPEKADPAGSGANAQTDAAGSDADAQADPAGTGAKAQSNIAGTALQDEFTGTSSKSQPATPDAWIDAMEDRMSCFDPAIFVEDGRAYLYFGFCRSFAVELEPDMLTAKTEPMNLIPNRKQAKGTPYEGHGFFEASSLRKIGGIYYFIYSSEKSHELCYATGEGPMGPFSYGGTLVSNGDIGINGRTRPVAQLGNTHGSIEQIGDKCYVFYHRQTNGTEFSRQGCAEEIHIGEDGSIAQVEITSQGLNGESLIASGSYPAAIACHISDRTMPEKIDYTNPDVKERVRVTQVQNQVFITGIKNRSKIGYKYFRFMDADLMAVELRGTFFGTLTIAFDEDGKQRIGEYEVQVNNGEWEMELIPIAPTPGSHALYLYFKGNGSLDMKSLAFFSA